MKSIVTLLLLTFTLSLQKNNRQLFNDFHIIYEKADFKAMNALLSDDFVGLNEKEEVSFEKKEYIDYMRDWNQVFKTKWNIVSVKEEGNTIRSIEYDTDAYNDYFYGGKRKVIYIYSFQNEKIKSIKTITTEEGMKADAVFENRYSRFYQWVSERYPEKLRFCGNSYDKRSAIEVKKLLELYLVATEKKV
jgi:hypothetical protein